ncbi:NAD-dependent deacylase [Aliiroseovarius sp.]|uniref:NAD-dependent deacylase n=1 Tax=Aliiroseovarius sp. TaxID=1872442 RepID=UPI002633D97A|nr:NAD-dependent deacylase [Aliiroseovarius sp.]
MTDILILTGAGVSAESGLGTFRDEDGLWTQYDLNDVCTPEGFARNPELVHDFYNARRDNCLNSAPNAAHEALGRLQRDSRHKITIVTQNVDDLHERGGAAEVLHMHGALSGALCHSCGARWPAPPVMDPLAPCPECRLPETRPDIVWFGEMPHYMDEIHRALGQASLFVAIGTSGNVYPAAGFVSEARAAGARTLELNLEPSSVAGQFDAARLGPATRTVPAWVDEVLAAE